MRERDHFVLSGEDHIVISYDRTAANGLNTAWQSPAASEKDWPYLIVTRGLQNELKQILRQTGSAAYDCLYSLFSSSDTPLNSFIFCPFKLIDYEM